MRLNKDYGIRFVASSSSRDKAWEKSETDKARRTRRDEQVSEFNHNKDRISVAFNEMGTMDQSSTADEFGSRMLY